MNNANTFARNLKAAREKAGLSQAALAKEAGVALQSISAYESTLNHKSPSINNAVKLANALNVSLDWLCGRDDVSSEESYDTYKKCALVVLALQRTIPNLSVTASVDFNYAEENQIHIYMSNEVLFRFFSDYNVMLELYKGGRLTVDILNQWLTGSLESLDINISQRGV